MTYRQMGAGYGMPGIGGAAGGYVPSIANLKNFQVNLNDWECLTQSLYDSASYVAAGQSNLQFFALPVGQGTGFGGGAKTLTDTNMTLAGQLPANQMFLVREIELGFEPTTPTVAAQMPAAYGAQVAAQLVNDAYIFYRAGNLVFTIGSKAYLTEAPLMKFPPMSVFEVQGGASDTTTAAGAGQLRTFFGGARGSPYVLAPNNLLLVQNQNFGLTLNWPEGLQTITNPARVIVTLNGLLYRKAQ